MAATIGTSARARRLRGELEAQHARSLPGYFRATAEPSLPERDRFTEILVAEAEGAGGVCGFVVVKVVETPRDPTLTGKRRAHVEMIGVGETWRRRGIGRLLMEAAERWAEARGCVETVLTVWRDNPAADALYRSLGYEPIARVLRKSTGIS